MKFLWKETLRRMTGNETTCPCCRTDGLVVTEREDRTVLPELRGIPYCACPSCRKRGDVAELVAQATDRSLEDTVRELHRIGELEAASRDLETYLSRKRLQAEVDVHLVRCVDKLRKAPHLGNIRAGLSIANLRQLPPDTGMHVSADGEVPRPFALLTAPRYDRVPLVLYRYRFDVETSCVDAQNPKTLQREHRLRVTGDVGVYLGDYAVGEVPSVLLGTPNPRAAGQVYGACRAESSLPPPVIGIAGFPLPNRFDAVRLLYLLDATDAPLSLAFALKALGGPLVYGVDRAPAVRVLVPRCPASDITAADIRMLGNTHAHGKSLHDWLAEKLLALADKPEEIAHALLQANASENVRLAILELLGTRATPSLRETILLPMAEPDDVFTLGNGKMVKNTPVGLYTAFRVKKTGELQVKSLLCNVGLSVDARIVDRGLETAVCTVTHPDADVPALTVRFPRAHWNNPDSLAEDVRAAYAESGRTPYVAFYRICGYAWSDLLQFLGAHCPVQSGLRALGALPDGTVNLPNAVLSRGTALPQTKAGLVDPDALAAYAALEKEHDPADAAALVRFLEGPVSLERTGLAAGLLQALFCLAGTLFEPSGVRRPPAHLVFVETEPGIWDETLRTLSYLFSGSEYVPLMDYGDRPGFLRNWSALGTLPLLTRLPAAEDIATVLATSPVSVIAVTDPLTAVLCSGRGTVSFVLPHVETATVPLTPEEITGLRKAFVATAAQKAGSGWLDIGVGGSVSLSTPCLSALGTLTEARNPDSVAGGLYRSVKGRYPGIGLTGSRAFFGVLHRAYMAQTNGDATGIKITLVQGAPADTVCASFNERGEHVFLLPDRVLVSRSIVPLVNREQAFLFDAEQLSHEFAENGILLNDAPGSLGIDSRRVWVFPRCVWDEEVVRATGFTTRKDTP